MAITIGTLNTGSLTIGSGSPTPAGHPETRFTLSNGTVETHDITGTLGIQWMIDNEYFDENIDGWTVSVTQVDIGNTVTSIGRNAFYACFELANVTIPSSVTSIGQSAFCHCTSLESVTIPSSVTSIGANAFVECSGLTSVTFQGKTLAQVQAMENYPWDIENTSIINVA